MLPEKHFADLKWAIMNEEMGGRLCLCQKTVPKNFIWTSNKIIFS
jgi:hypothetical protein